MSRRTFNAIACSLLTLACVWGCLPSWDEPMALAAPRSGQWAKVRASYLAKHPKCEACGGREGLQVHHVIPFAKDGGGDEDEDGISNELDEDNLITLCTHGPGGISCHFCLGHAARSWKHFNHNVRRDALRFRTMMLEAQSNEPNDE